MAKSMIKRPSVRIIKSLEQSVLIEDKIDISSSGYVNYRIVNDVCFLRCEGLKIKLASYSTTAILEGIPTSYQGCMAQRLLPITADTWKGFTVWVYPSDNKLYLSTLNNSRWNIGDSLSGFEICYPIAI